MPNAKIAQVLINLAQFFYIKYSPDIDGCTPGHCHHIHL